jgi:hypothetical protein
LGAPLRRSLRDRGFLKVVSLMLQSHEISSVDASGFAAKVGEADE